MNPPDCYASSADQIDQDVYCKQCRTGPLTEAELLAEQVWFPAPMCSECIAKAEEYEQAEARAEMYAHG
jgi:hypothetical protein